MPPGRETPCWWLPESTSSGPRSSSGEGHHGEGRGRPGSATLRLAPGVQGSVVTFQDAEPSGAVLDGFIITGGPEPSWTP